MQKNVTLVLVMLIGCSFIYFMYSLYIKHSNERPPQIATCECPLAKEYRGVFGHVQSHTGNANEGDFKKDDYVKIEGAADIDISKGLKSPIKGNLKIAFPIESTTEKEYIYYDFSGQLPENEKKYFLYYCSNWHTYVNPANCEMPDSKKEIFAKLINEMYSNIFTGTSSSKNKPLFNPPVYQATTSRLPVSLGRDCDGNEILITDKNIAILLNNIAFVNQQNMDLSTAEKHLQLVCDENPHELTAKRIQDALCFIYIIKNRIQNASFDEIKARISDNRW